MWVVKSTEVRKSRKKDSCPPLSLKEVEEKEKRERERERRRKSK